MMHFDQFLVDHIFELRLFGKADSVATHRVPIAHHPQFTVIVLSTEIIQDHGVVQEGVQFSEIPCG